MEVQSFAEQLFFTTVHIEGRHNDSTWVGTGFIYAVETDAGTAHFLITNKHVLEGASRVQVRMIRHSVDGDLPALGRGSQITIKQFHDDAWRGHPDPTVDVAALPFAAVLAGMIGMGATPYFKALLPEHCLTASSAAELDAIEEVSFIGYPNGLFDSKNLLPVARRGTTATPIQVDYQGHPAFLIDASVFPGSSGSPVFIHDQGMYRTKTGATVIGSRFLLLGVLAAVHVRQVQGEVQELPARLAVHFDEPIDLGIVYKAATFDACVDPLLAAHGVKRLPGQRPTQPDVPTAVDEQLAPNSDSRQQGDR